MLRLDGEVFLFGTAMAKTLPGQSFNPPIQPQTTGRLPGKTGRGAKPNRAEDARAFSAGKSK
jgi:hypothetical protein